MGDLEVRIEIAKLSAELGVGDDRLDFLWRSSPAEVRALRDLARDAVAARNAERVERLGSLTKMAPTGVAAKVAQHAFGPALSARVAGAVAPADAVRLASHLPPAFLAELAVSLEPSRVGPIVERLPDELLVDIGRRLLAAGEHAALARLVAVVSPALAARVVADATGEQLLQIALFADDPALIESVAERLTDEQLGGILSAADEHDPEAATLLLGRMSARTRKRITALAEEA
ncbi:hypothetical protein [Nocardioides sp. SYSU DS0651]|uniref:hypothetical protein n=1 Tax=Nocardioides sp. SYSU DS0651 TaxID=3415955 RepID=UPI003F4C3637